MKNFEIWLEQVERCNLVVNKETPHLWIKELEIPTKKQNTYCPDGKCLYRIKIDISNFDNSDEHQAIIGDNSHLVGPNGEFKPFYTKGPKMIAPRIAEIHYTLIDPKTKEEIAKMSSVGTLTALTLYRCLKTIVSDFISRSKPEFITLQTGNKERIAINSRFMNSVIKGNYHKLQTPHYGEDYKVWLYQRSDVQPSPEEAGRIAAFG